MSDSKQGSPLSSEQCTGPIARQETPLVVDTAPGKATFSTSSEKALTGRTESTFAGGAEGLEEVDKDHMRGEIGSRKRAPSVQSEDMGIELVLPRVEITFKEEDLKKH